ncbi:hypothetical protein KQX54_006124 [Cotesia glomerata]|uniref:RING-type domain-containing protein n=1 Tax=Cotesia glomerata TaxID=32391 RepID=A0AAV7J220_COTGL|nr:hypothetical protein KQX54_006124 [Cotesia glomerata]
MELIKTEGKLKNSHVFSYGDWNYYGCNKDPNRFYCCKRFTRMKCPVILTQNEDGSVEVEEEYHNHPKSQRNLVETIKNELKRKAVEDADTPNGIAKNVIKRYKYSPISIDAARKIVNSTILQYQKDKPQTLFQLAQMLEINILYKNIYKGFCAANDDLLNRKWNTLNLPDEYDNEVSDLSFILKLLPQKMVTKGIDFLTSKGDKLSEDYEDYKAYCKFVEKCELFITNENFINENTTDAIQYSENFILNEIRELGIHQTIHLFLQSLKNYIYQSEKKFLQVTENTKVYYQVKITQELKQVQKKLENEKLTIEQFKNHAAVSSLIKKLFVALSRPQCTCFILDRDDNGKLESFPNPKIYYAVEENDNEKEFENPCAYCFSEESSIETVGCGHLIGCYTCWYEDFYRFKNRTCPRCRSPYEKVNIH